MKKIVGYNGDRLKANESWNADEKLFNELFNKEGNRNWDVIVFGTNDMGGPKERLSARELKIAASIIQWLGTNVGNGFLAQADYYKRKSNGKKTFKEMISNIKDKVINFNLGREDE